MDSIAAVLFAALARNAFWQPAGLYPTAISVADVRTSFERSTELRPVAYSERVERYHVVAKGTPFDSIVTIRGDDVRISTVLAGATYRTGRNGGRRWRETPSGVVRIVASDVQGDDLDRWPIAALGFAFGDCVVAGETRGAQRAFVLEDDADGDVPHWLYFDAGTGELVREVSRDGSRTVDYAFGDFRTADGIRRPFGWHVDGAGGQADVTLVGVDERAVAPELVAIPQSSGAATFASASTLTERVPLRYDARRREFYVDVSVNGRRSTFVLDTGTTQMLVDGGAARRLGLRETLDHTVVSSLAIGKLVASDVPFLTVGLGGFDFDGILGNEFFLGHVVHVDYDDGYVEIIPHAAFVRPPDSIAIPVSYAEGMPLARATVGSFQGDRFALDTGSSRIVLPAYLIEHGGSASAFQAIGRGGAFTFPFLEGALIARKVHVPTFALGDIAFSGGADAFVGESNGSIDIPLDGILGTSVLSIFDLWFDYDNGALYVKPFRP